MTIQNSIFCIFILLFSCTSKEETKPTQEAKLTDTLKTHQQYALNRIKEADFDDLGFALTDSFYLWSPYNFGREFKNNRITRTHDNGFYYYTFWTHLRDTSFIYSEVQIPTTDLVKDTMFDNNSDGFKDFILIYKPDHTDTLIFHLDTSSKKFLKAKP